MGRIGVSDLRQPVSRYLAHVANGETIVTERGRPIALLAPTPPDRWTEMVASGQIIEAHGEGNVIDDPSVGDDLRASTTSDGRMPRASSELSV